MPGKSWIFLLLAAAPAVADDCKPRAVDPGIVRQLAIISARSNRACPALPDVPDLCMAVSQKLHQPDPVMRTRYVYQNMIYRAACVDPGDSPDLIRGKVRQFWNTHHSRLTCTQLAFTIRDGHLLKLAVERNAEDFLEEVVWDWQLDLNHVDAVDGRTVLDYVRDAQAQAEGTSRARVFKRYHDLLRDEGGARFASER
jgi:hypothetical protein